MADVTVIVPARNVAATLPATLRALEAQRFAGEHDVIVVDDRSTDETARIAAAAGAQVLHTRSRGGAGEARNLGAAAATTPLLAFTDADCEPHPDWLAGGVAALRNGADLVQGRILPTPDTPVGSFDRTLRVEHPSPLYETANLFVTRDIFERTGGFPAIGPVPGGSGRLRLPDEKNPFGEDTLFGWAARRAGARPAFVPESVVYHAVFPRSARGYVAERHRLRFFPGLVRDVPELRGHLIAGVFLSRRTAAFDFAVAGTLAATIGRRPAALLLALPYFRIAGAPWPPRPHALRRFAVDVAADAVGLAALASGSARRRTPVL